MNMGRIAPFVNVAMCDSIEVTCSLNINGDDHVLKAMLINGGAELGGVIYDGKKIAAMPKSWLALVPTFSDQEVPDAMT